MMNTLEGPGPRRHLNSLGVRTALLAALLSSCITRNSLDGLRTGEREFSHEELAQLKRTTTVFFLRHEDEPRRDEFEEALERAWHLTEIEVAPFSRAGEYADPTKYSYLVIEGERLASFPITFYHLSLLTRTPSDGEDEEPESTGYCRIELQSTWSEMQLMVEQEGRDSLEEVYRQAEFLNWSPALLATYLQSVQTDLARRQRRALDDGFSSKQGMERLRAATLYVPDHLLVDFHTGGDEAKRHDPKDLLSEYPGRYRIVTHEELESLVARSETLEDPIFIFDYVTTATGKVISIYEYGWGLIYRDHSIFNSALSSGDFDVF